MTYDQAVARAERLNATRYKNSRIRVVPSLYGGTWVLIGEGRTKQMPDVEAFRTCYVPAKARE